MGAKKSPQLVKGKVVGARFTANELALMAIDRGSRPEGTWLGDIARERLAKVKKQLEEKD